MASEIKVDTISEKTSAGGVTIDGLLIKDGGISGDVSLIGTTPTFTIGDAGAEDATLLFDGNAQDFHIGLDDTADSLVIGLGSTLGTTPAMTVNASQVVTFAQNPVFPDGGVAVDDLDIDGATDIGAAIVDADLFIVDDGAGGTNRKVTASRIKTYAGGAVTAINNATANELVTIGSTTTELDAEANLTFDGTTLAVAGTVEPAGDTAAGDNAAIGYTASEGLILTGQGSSSDVTIKNDADGLVCRVPTGSDDLNFADNAKILIGTGGGDMQLYHDGSNSYITNADAGSIIVYGNTLNHQLKVHNYNGNFQQGALNMLDVVCAAATTGANFDFMECTASDGSALRLRIADDGDVTNANNSYGSSSDERIKQNIADASSQWDDVKNFKVKKFKLKKDVNQEGEENTPYHLGVIAQDLETDNMNGLVKHSDPCAEDTTLHSDFGTVVDGTADNGAEPIRDEDGNITGYKDLFTPGQKVKAIKYSVLYMKAVKALQEAQTRIETLEAKVAALEG